MNHPPSCLQTGLRSRTGFIRARGQSSHFQKPPRATQSPLQKQYCFLGTAAELWPDTMARFSKIFQTLKIQIKILEEFSRQLSGHHNTCIHQAPELLGHLEKVSFHSHVPRFSGLLVAALPHHETCQPRRFKLPHSREAKDAPTVSLNPQKKSPSSQT